MSRAELEASYRLAARTTRREAGNFYIAFLSLPRAERRAVYALYAFFRELDDAADGAHHGAQRLDEGLRGEARPRVPGLLRGDDRR